MKRLFVLSCLFVGFLCLYQCSVQHDLDGLPELNSRIENLKNLKIDTTRVEVFWDLKDRIDEADLTFAQDQPNRDFDLINLLFYKGKLVMVWATTDPESVKFDSVFTEESYIEQTEIDAMYELLSQRPRVEAWRYIKYNETFILIYGGKLKRITEYVHNPIY